MTAEREASNASDEPDVLRDEPDAVRDEPAASRTGDERSLDDCVVEEVSVVRAPGFEVRGFSVTGCSPGVTVVYGPNGSGKSTLASAIQWLLWPETADGRTTLLGQLSIDGDEWRVSVEAGRGSYQRNGQKSSGPGLPSADQRDRYHLSLHELLQHQVRNESFARAIRRESTGGYDLSAAYADLGFDDEPSSKRKGVFKDAEAAVDALQEARGEVEALRSERGRLPGLESRLDEARASAERVALLDRAIEHARARDELGNAEADLARFPEILRRIDGGEADDVDGLDERIEAASVERERAAAELADAREELAEADLPDAGLPEGFVERLKQRRDELGRIEAEKRDLEGDLEQARAERTSALEDIPAAVESTDLADLDPTAWKEVFAFAREAESIRAEREVHGAVERWLRDNNRPDEDLLTLQRGRQRLEAWLAHPPAKSSGGRATVGLAMVSALLVGVAGIALADAVPVASSLFIPAALAILVFGLWYGYRARHGAGVDRSRRAHRESFDELGLRPPNSWTPEAVRVRLTELTDAIAAHRLADQREQRLAALSTGVDDLVGRESAIEERRSALRERYGLAPDTTDVELVVFTKRVLRWQESHDRVVGLEAEISSVGEQLESVRQQLVEELAPYGYETVTDSAAATGHIRDLERRGDRHDRATRAIAHAEGAIEEARERIERLSSEREAIFTEIGLDPDEHERLRELCDRAEAYQEAVSAVEKARTILDREATKLEQHPDFDPELRTETVSELERERRDAKALADTYDEVRDEITEIETKIRAAKGDFSVEEALAEKERALDALANQLDRDCAAMVGHALVEHVRAATSEVSRPAVFEHARDILARITMGRYRLELDDEGETFRTYDTVAGRGLALDELSSGTRVQVLLAVRLAFIERQEHGVALPLLMDETLANTDDGRAEAIVESTIELARAGRQVFYFTAQGDEVAKWLAALEDTGDVDYATIDLADVRDLDEHVRIPDLATDSNHDEPDVGRPSPPSPEGHDHASYGEALGVAPFDPREGSGAAHLWYVVDEVDLLHRLLDLGIERWGQLETLLASGGGQAIADDPDRLAPIERDGRALAEFVRSWRVGRGERVDRQVLEASGAVSATFIDEVSALATEFDGDGDAVVESLYDGSVDRFRQSKAAALEAYLEDNGYIEAADPLDAAQIRARVADSMVESGLSSEAARDRAFVIVDRLQSGAVAE